MCVPTVCTYVIGACVSAITVELFCPYTYVFCPAYRTSHILLLDNHMHTRQNLSNTYKYIHTVNDKSYIVENICGFAGEKQNYSVLMLKGLQLRRCLLHTYSHKEMCGQKLLDCLAQGSQQTSGVCFEKLYILWFHYYSHSANCTCMYLQMCPYTLQHPLLATIMCGTHSWYIQQKYTAVCQ